MIAKISGNSFFYAIFSGGNSSRMEYDKSLLSINGQTVIQRIAGDIQNSQLVDGDTFIVSNTKKYTQLKDDYFNFNKKPEFQHACDIFQGKYS